MKRQSSQSRSRDNAERLIEIGIALSGTHDLDTLLALILTEARHVTDADGGTLYLVEENRLKAVIAQCDTLSRQMGEDRFTRGFRSFSLPLDGTSIAGAAATRPDVINIVDVQTLPQTSGFSYNPQSDRMYGYNTHSTLAVPMQTRTDEVIGVLQLINAQADGVVCPFSDASARMAKALASQAAVAIQTARLTEGLRQAHLETVHCLGVAAEWRDKETSNHIIRVALVSGLLARRLGGSDAEVERLMHASTMHDVGKLGIPDAILTKPGPLDPRERALMETHCVLGATILKGMDNALMRLAQEVCLCHHEKWDGTGYPRRLSAADIPTAAAIVALVDVYDALTSRRCYKPPFPEEEVIRIIREGTGKHFAPHIVDRLLKDLNGVRSVRGRFPDSEEDLQVLKRYDRLTLDWSILKDDADLGPTKISRVLRLSQLAEL